VASSSMQAIPCRPNHHAHCSKWEKDHLELGNFLVENVVTGARLLPKRLCDRLWNAFHYERAMIFDVEGNWLPK
jgi:hypothetical protein